MKKLTIQYKFHKVLKYSSCSVIKSLRLSYPGKLILLVDFPISTHVSLRLLLDALHKLHYITVIVDDFTKFIWVGLYRKKSDIRTGLVDFFFDIEE